MSSLHSASSRAPSVPGRIGIHSSAMAEYPVRTGLMEMKRPPSRLNCEIAILSGLRVMVLGGADHHEELRALEVRAAELPERAADGVDHAGGHVHRAEAAVRGVVRRAELPREEAGERLHLVAAGEEARISSDRSRGFSLRRSSSMRERLVPGDGLELAGAALGAGLARSGCVSRAGEYCFMMPERALGADHALVERMLRVAVDVAHLCAVAQMHADAAAARAHVAGGGLGARHLDLLALSYSRVRTNSRWPSASAAVSRPLAVRNMQSSSLSPAWSGFISLLQQARDVHVDVLRHGAHGARVGAQLDHRQDRVADDVALPGREEMHRVARRRAQRHHLGRRGGRIHEPQARAGRHLAPCRARRRPCTCGRSSGCCRAPSPRWWSGRPRCCPWSAASRTGRWSCGGR